MQLNKYKNIKLFTSYADYLNAFIKDIEQCDLVLYSLQEDYKYSVIKDRYGYSGNTIELEEYQIAKILLAQ